MGTLYEQLSLRERVEIDIGRRKGLSIQAIGQMLGRSASTISRELGRNGRPTRHWRGSYDGERADGLAARRRRWDARHKLARQPALAITVRDYLAMGWSPEIIAGRLARQHGCTIISPESIYRFVYHRSAQKDYWHRLLPRAKSRRGPLGRRGGSPLRTFKDRVPLSQRPAQAQGRTVPGHWEADLMAFSRYGQAVLVTHERSSRQLVIERLPSKAAQGVVDRLIALFQSLPKALCQTVTFDNGTEFAFHYQLNAIGIPTYFCDPHAPWQKGGVENAIGRMRRRLPRKSDLATITDEHLQTIVALYNNTPRKCLDFQTPNEVFSSFSNRVALQT